MLRVAASLRYWTLRLLAADAAPLTFSIEALPLPLQPVSFPPQPLKPSLSLSAPQFLLIKCHSSSAPCLRSRSFEEQAAQKSYCLHVCVFWEPLSSVPWPPSPCSSCLGVTQRSPSRGRGDCQARMEHQVCMPLAVRSAAPAVSMRRRGCPRLDSARDVVSGGRISLQVKPHQGPRNRQHRRRNRQHRRTPHQGPRNRHHRRRRHLRAELCHEMALCP